MTSASATRRRRSKPSFSSLHDLRHRLGGSLRAGAGKRSVGPVPSNPASGCVMLSRGSQVVIGSIMVMLGSLLGCMGGVAEHNLPIGKLGLVGVGVGVVCMGLVLIFTRGRPATT